MSTKAVFSTASDAKATRVFDALCLSAPQQVSVFALAIIFKRHGRYFLEARGKNEILSKQMSQKSFTSQGRRGSFARDFLFIDCFPSLLTSCFPST